MEVNNNSPILPMNFASFRGSVLSSGHDRANFGMDWALLERLESSVVAFSSFAAACEVACGVSSSSSDVDISSSMVSVSIYSPSQSNNSSPSSTGTPLGGVIIWSSCFRFFGLAVFISWFQKSIIVVPTNLYTLSNTK